MNVKHQISGQAARLKKLRLYLGLTREQLGQRLGISPFTLRSWENGHKGFNEKAIKRVIFYLKERLDFLCSFEWLMYGTGDSPISLYEEATKKEFDIKFDSIQEKILKEIITFKSLNREASVIVVSDEGFLPIAHRGDYIGLLPVNFSKLKQLVGQMIYVALKKGASQFGILTKKEKNYHILPFAASLSFPLSPKTISELFLVIWFRKLTA